MSGPFRFWAATEDVLCGRGTQEGVAGGQAGIAISVGDLLLTVGAYLLQYPPWGEQGRLSPERTPRLVRFYYCHQLRFAFSRPSFHARAVTSDLVK